MVAAFHSGFYISIVHFMFHLITVIDCEPLQRKFFYEDMADLNSHGYKDHEYILLDLTFIKQKNN